MPVGIRTKPEPYCPKCGAKMRLIRAGQGRTKKPFWTCPLWHEDGCDGKRQVDPETGEPD